MKIKAVRATPVLVPVRPFEPKLWIKRDHIDRTVVEIETDTGLLGIGETRGIWSAAIINELFAPALIGASVLERRSTRGRCLNKRFDHGFPERFVELTAYSGVELALWDLAGKAAGLPVFRLLGGPARQRANFCAYGYPVDPSDGWEEDDVPRLMAELAVRSLAETGASLFEFKVARLPSVACDIRTVHKVREVVGSDVDIAVDANMGYNREQARRFIAETKSANLANIEEPVASLSETARLRSDFGVPMSTHCTMLDALAAYPPIDAVVIDLHAIGGIEATVTLVSQLSALGKQVWLRSVWELGISFAAMCHLAIALPELSRPSQALANFPLDDLIDGDPWSVSEGGCRPPERPGLGIDLDQTALERYGAS